MQLVALGMRLAAPAARLQSVLTVGCPHRHWESYAKAEIRALRKQLETQQAQQGQQQQQGQQP